MPGGNTRTTVYAKPHPIYVKSGIGARVVDVDGLTYLDLDNNFTALIHGHGFTPIAEALREQAVFGTSFGAATEFEVELAELLCERVPYFEHVRFMNTGTEAVMNAVKAARALTGRYRIAKFEGAYHGSYDHVQVSLDSSPSNWGEGKPRPVAYDVGTPPSALSETVVLPFNDEDGCRAILDVDKTELAAILIDPLPSRLGLIPADPGFLRFLRDYTSDNGMLLISDEVLSFRLGAEGAISQSDVEADLCAFGKIIGGGMPIGAVAGPREFMAAFDPSKGKPAVSQAGTFSANPMSLRAGLEAMRAMTPQRFEEINELGAYSRAQLSACLSDTGVEGQVVGAGSLFKLHFKCGSLRNYRDTYPADRARQRLTRLVAFARDNGILLPASGLGCLSTVMTQSDIDEFVDVLRNGLRIIAKEES
ncbi:aminotransferase class III-fold pyridoxal phosphate-dependent enzyme [Pelagibius litoralis]|uniref:Aminotransferase class III-fold pyridoxal phosphate-dependent enzyme n=1 Tax=Pelagibius litoralis TaxID=374515 RepID=A0A967EZV2_9PROT|nr:aminotransferase class III-fold pyridoxal phosphate-dependent enzyme [Pelagibius litoralis]NIA70429.1 aminotransferase class III-fold pyridoxal phosphate-dependent enzyme [Pelagibius litoralis]